MNGLFEFAGALMSLKGQECWAVVAGEGTGSHISLDFGKRIERARALRNPRLSEAVRRFTGEYGLFVRNCSWRLTVNAAIICTSRTPNDNDGVMVGGLQSLVGQFVRGAQADGPTYDLIIDFSDGGRLQLFCDCFDQDRDGDNYSFYAPGHVFTLSASCRFVCERRRTGASSVQ
jgi:hypothetical protein